MVQRPGERPRVLPLPEFPDHPQRGRMSALVKGPLAIPFPALSTVHNGRAQDLSRENLFRTFMWKVLGVETIMINADTVWADRLIVLSQRRKDGPRFRELLGKADRRYFFDTIREIHVFYLKFPPTVTLEDLEFMKGFIMKLHAAAKVPVVEFDGEAQRASVAMTSEEDRDDHKGRNKWWENKEEGEEETQSI